MKKLLLCTAALTMFSGSALALNGSNVKADDGNSTTNTTNTSSNGPKANTSKNNMESNGNKIQTNTYFEVDNSGSSTPAANPNNPGSKLSDPDNHNVYPTGATGNLTIDAVPNTLNFGKTNENLESNTINENLNFGEDNSYYYAQVSDFRKSHNGWNLTANMSNMNNNDPSLKGSFLQNASLNFTNNKVTGAYSNDTKDGSSNGVNTKNPITLTPSSGNVSMMDANNGYGSGTWLNRFNNINLIATRSDAGEYNGTITWNLTEGPNSSN